VVGEAVHVPVLHVSGVADPAVIVVGVIEGATEMVGTLVGIIALLIATPEPIEFVAVTLHVTDFPISAACVV
jgi:zinc transporter ZupT